jgi:hypothetical protein
LFTFVKGEEQVFRDTFFEEINNLRNFLATQIERLNTLIVETQETILRTLNVRFTVLETTLGEIAATLGTFEISVLAAEALLTQTLGAVLAITGEINTVVLAEHLMTRSKISSVGEEIKVSLQRTEDSLKVEIASIKNQLQLERSSARTSCVDDFKEFQSALEKEFFDNFLTNKGQYLIKSRLQFLVNSESI